MQLVSPLCSGIVGAASGHAEVYRRGTGTRATWYSSFEASGANSSGANIWLDSNGGATVYVNEVVDVRVYDSGGLLVRQFTAGEGAPAVELISPAFTGTDYATGQSATSKPTTVQAALSAWLASALAPDFNVLVGGVATPLAQAIEAFAGFFVNVRLAAYGALGNGVADDTDAIQDAIDAASAAGGGTVFFPAGTYRVTSAITVPDAVSLLGCGSGNTAIVTDHASEDTLVFDEESTSGAQYVQGLRVAVLQENNGNRIMVTGAAHVICLYCYVGDADATGFGFRGTDAGALLVAIGTTFLVADAGERAFYTVMGAAVAIACRFLVAAGATPNGIMLGVPAVVLACDFDMSAGAIDSWKLVDSATFTIAIGNRFTEQAGGGSTIVCLDGATVWELGNLFVNWPTATMTPVDLGANNVGITGYLNRTETVQNDGASVAVTPEFYNRWRNRRTTTANQTIAVGVPRWQGQRIVLTYHADGGNIATVTVTGVLGLTTFAINNNLVNQYWLEAIHNGTTLHWNLTGSLVNQSDA